MFALNILLAIAWTALMNELSWTNLLFGFFLGYLIIFFASQGGLTDKPTYILRVVRLVRFTAFFLKEVILSNIRIMIEVLTPTHYMKPGVVAVPLDAKTDLEIFMLANLVTLTPGTLSLEVSEDKKTLYIHAMYVDKDDLKSFRTRVKEDFEKRLLEVLR